MGGPQITADPYGAFWRGAEEGALKSCDRPARRQSATFPVVIDAGSRPLYGERPPLLATGQHLRPQPCPLLTGPVKGPAGNGRPHRAYYQGRRIVAVTLTGQPRLKLPYESPVCSRRQRHRLGGSRNPPLSYWQLEGSGLGSIGLIAGLFAYIGFPKH